MIMTTKTSKPGAPRARTSGSPVAWSDEERRQIAERAYHLFLERGGHHGYELDDWLKAEAGFAAARKPAKTPRTRRK